MSTSSYSQELLTALTFLWERIRPLALAHPWTPGSIFPASVDEVRTFFRDTVSTLASVLRFMTSGVNVPPTCRYLLAWVFAFATPHSTRSGPKWFLDQFTSYRPTVDTLGAYYPTAVAQFVTDLGYLPPVLSPSVSPVASPRPPPVTPSRPAPVKPKAAPPKGSLVPVRLVPLSALPVPTFEMFQSAEASRIQVLKTGPPRSSPSKRRLSPTSAIPVGASPTKKGKNRPLPPDADSLSDIELVVPPSFAPDPTPAPVSTSDPAPPSLMSRFQSNTRIGQLIAKGSKPKEPPVERKKKGKGKADDPATTLTGVATSGGPPIPLPLSMAEGELVLSGQAPPPSPCLPCFVTGTGDSCFYRGFGQPCLSCLKTRRGGAQGRYCTFYNHPDEQFLWGVLAASEASTSLPNLSVILQQARYSADMVHQLERLAASNHANLLRSLDDLRDAFTTLIARSSPEEVRRIYFRSEEDMDALMTLLGSADEERFPIFRRFSSWLRDGRQPPSRADRIFQIPPSLVSYGGAVSDLPPMSPNFDALNTFESPVGSFGRELPGPSEVLPPPSASTTSFRSQTVQRMAVPPSSTPPSRPAPPASHPPSHLQTARAPPSSQGTSRPRAPQGSSSSKGR
ncbi:hypothetical protein CVT24_012197 [Panaeolus cyanescens]|uniref:Uncharacterized protein n=1 Tax=Panaeolus cyanescens TaxID=181874 RepID=A0A409WXC3_9AGAR|nr:hypothetical protein CVT24_012197 [Panaeolus cyanescens]